VPASTLLVAVWLVIHHTGPAGPIIAIEATGGLHHAWMRELDLRFSGSVRLFAPSDTTANRATTRRTHRTDHDRRWIALARCGPAGVAGVTRLRHRP